MALSCVGIRDLDISQGPHVDKMAALSTALPNKTEDCLRCMVHHAQVNNRPSCETIGIVASELFVDEIVNWGRIVAPYSFGRFFLQSMHESGSYSYEYMFTLKRQLQPNYLDSCMATGLYLWITSNGGWVSFIFIEMNYQVNISAHF